jgi:formate dehydrogenase subunit gamma
MSDLASSNASALSSLVTPFLDRVGGPLSALCAVVEQYGYVDDQAVLTVADVFNLSRAEVRGIVSFYHDLRTTAPAQHTIHICQAEACQAVGARELTRRLTARFGVELGGVSADGRVGIEAVYCLGLCANGPSMRIDDTLVARTDLADESLLSALERS